MARLPDVQTLGARPVARPTRALPAGDAGAGAVARAADITTRQAALAGRGLAISAQALGDLSKTAQGVARVVDEVEERRAKAKDRLALARANALFASADIQTRSALEGDPDWATYQERYNAAISEVHTEIKNGLPDYMRQSFEASTLVDITRGQAEIQGKARRQETDSSRADLTQMLADNQEAGLRAQDAQSRGRLLGSSAEAIESARALGYISDQEAQKMRQDSASDFAVSRYAIVPAEQRLDLLQEGIAIGPDGQPIFRDTGTVLDRIPADKRAGMIVEAQREIVAAESLRLRKLDRADRLADKALKEQRDDLETELTTRILDGEDVSEHEITRYGRDRQLEASQVSRLINMNRSEDAIDEPNVILNLSRDAAWGDPSIPGRIAAARENGLISIDSAKQVQGSYIQSQRGGGIMARDDVRRARDYIDSVIGGVRGPLAILDSASSIRVANALREFDSLVTEQSDQSTAFDPMTIADQINQKYRLTPETVTELAQPQFLVGTRSQPDIDATRQRTLEAIDSGEITREEGAAELGLLERIEDAMPGARGGTQ